MNTDLLENNYQSRSKKFGFQPVVESFTIEELVNRWGDACYDCGNDWSEVDHVIPIAAGGQHTLANCQPVCHSCNLKRWSAYADGLEESKRRLRQKIRQNKNGLLVLDRKKQERLDLIAELEAQLAELEQSE